MKTKGKSTGARAILKRFGGADWKNKMDFDISVTWAI